MKEAQQSFNIFMEFMKNTKDMVTAISNQNKFVSDISLQISVINDMLNALNNLKDDLEGIMKNNIEIKDKN